jgi:hypothetical protein
MISEHPDDRFFEVHQRTKAGFRLLRAMLDLLQN